jgi:hypothetical protein
VRCSWHDGGSVDQPALLVGKNWRRQGRNRGIQFAYLNDPNQWKIFRFAPARAVLAEQPWVSIKRDGLLYFVGVRFSCGEMVFRYFLVGPSRQKRGARVLSRRAGSSGISLRIFSLVKWTENSNRAGFEPQRASPYMK